MFVVDVSVDRELTVKLDEISEHYRSKGICEGDECQQLMVQCVAPVQTEWGISDVVTQHQLVYRSAAMLDYMASMVRNLFSTVLQLHTLYGQDDSGVNPSITFSCSEVAVLKANFALGRCI